MAALDEDVVGQRHQLATPIAGHQAGRDSGRAHQDNEGSREEFGVAFPGFEPESVQRIGTSRWREAVAHTVTAIGQRGQCLLQYGIGVAGAGQRGAERTQAWVAVLRQGEGALSQRRQQFAASRPFQPRTQLIADFLSYRLVRQYLPVRCNERLGGQPRREIQPVEPETAVGCQADPVMDFLASRLKTGTEIRGAPPTRLHDPAAVAGRVVGVESPFLAVEVVEHRPTPIKQAGRWYPVSELGNQHGLAVARSGLGLTRFQTA